MSAPATMAKVPRATTKSSTKGSKPKKVIPPVFANAEASANERSAAICERSLLEAFAATCDGYSADRVIADPELSQLFADKCRTIGLPGGERDWNHLLFHLRKSGKLAEIKTTRRTELPWEEFDKLSFASEIALRQMIDAGADSLDDILCDPQLSQQFDAIAERFALGSKPVWYRLAALKLRKEAKNARTRAQTLKIGRLSKALALRELTTDDLPEAGGIFVVQSGREQLFVGESLNLRERVRASFRSSALSAWETLAPQKKSSLSFSYCRTDGDIRDLLGYQSKFVDKLKPRYNFELSRA
jgi:hypothetical protein